jgi:uncharacterized membrane protein
LKCFQPLLERWSLMKYDGGLVLKTLGLGAIAGARSMAAPAALSRAVGRGEIGGLEQTPFAALGSRGVSRALRLCEIGELLVDKLPVAPSRTSPLPLLGRAASGAFVGSALFVSGERRAVTGGALGAVAALMGAYAAERLRLRVAEKFGVPDTVVALVEDGIVVLGAARLLR